MRLASTRPSTRGSVPDLTPSQRRRLDRVRKDAFEALRRERQQILSELHAEGLSYRQLGKEMGVSHSRVERWIKGELD